MLLTMFVLGGMLLVSDFMHSRKALEGGLVRNTYGIGSRMEDKF